MSSPTELDITAAPAGRPRGRIPAPAAVQNGEAPRPRDAPIVFDVSGLSGDPVSSLSVNSCKFTGVANGTDKISNTSAVKFTNVTINGKSVSR